MAADSELFVGLISGTSMDAVDAVLASFCDDSVRLLATHSHPIPAELKTRLHTLTREPATTLDALGELDHRLGCLFGEAAMTLLSCAEIAPARVRAIGSHGQTVRHRPDSSTPFTLQLGDPTRIVEATGILTVADFRRGDMAAGGQGAPLVPPFHAWLLKARKGRHTVLNLGGIANLSLIEDGELYGGFDTGPASTLLDAWTRRHLDLAFDESGSWAAGGSVDSALLERLLAEPYLQSAPPKSTGFELFNLDWLDAHLAQLPAIVPRDVMSTLAQYSVESIGDALEQHWPACTHGWICGGGERNTDLLERLRRRTPDTHWASTDALGMPPAWMEAAAFAWLARARLRGLPGNAPRVTGARHNVILGGVYC
ncbi:MAG: anhydro-N-acetylmuramic acid kinase [Gammaproteobacteria bacterium]|nr:anhydro-N-acetylmuramic acid kinase [Gammaproteobacteria bacterium]